MSYWREDKKKNSLDLPESNDVWNRKLSMWLEVFFLYFQILSQPGERCVPVYIEKRCACSRCSNHRGVWRRGTWERACVRVRACSDSLQRKFDMCLVTWDMVYGWPAKFWRLKWGRHQPRCAITSSQSRRRRTSLNWRKAAAFEGLTWWLSEWRKPWVHICTKYSVRQS